MITAKLESAEGSEGGIILAGSNKKVPIFKP